ncbi:MAG: DUF4381 domain-containing protein [Pseudomonadales bacterium]
MNDPLSQLRDIHLPATISWWPPAPGWWILLALIMLAISAGWYIRRRNYLRLAYRRDALEKLHIIFNEYKEHGYYQQYLREISILLKQVSLHCHGGSNLATLSGAAWCEYLRETCPDETYHQSILAFSEEIYRIRGSGDANGVKTFAEYWIAQQQLSRRPNV